DVDGEYPWSIHIRSFISAKKVGGGLFKGDGRGPSLSTASTVTSRVRSNFIVDPAKGTISNPTVKSDYTVFYGGNIPPVGYIPPAAKKGSPTASIENEKFSPNSASFDFSHSGKDPITPSFFTPSLDVHASLTIAENLEEGKLSIKGSFTGDVFPSTEAFITDQSGKTKLFLNAKMEEGGVGDLFGDNKIKLFNVDMEVLIDKKGNFTGVREGDKTYSVEDWNKKIVDNAKSDSSSKTDE
ncbi:MAG: hypothetical protein KDD41_09240, partial [Flavobacteriales bacterium]|nr:hypothetical protein [Flavobacteriales bacterium]